MKPRSEFNRLPLPKLAERRFGGGGFDSLGLVTDEALEAETGVLAGFALRTGGVSRPPYSSLNIATHVGDDPAAVSENTRRLLDALGAGPGVAPVAPVQVHGSDVAVYVEEGSVRRVRDALAAEGIAGCLFPGHPGAGAAGEDALTPVCDAVVSLLPGLPVMMCYADCVPVIVVAPSGGFAVVHSGWRGAIVSIAGKAARVLAIASDCDPSSLNAYIGPYIGGCCYEVGEDLLARFERRFGEGCRAEGGCRLDLGFAVGASLREAGLLPERIADAGICTADSTDRFYSYRAENGKTGRFAAVCLRRPGGASGGIDGAGLTEKG